MKREGEDGERQQGVWEVEQETAERKPGERKSEIRGLQIGYTLSKLHSQPRVTIYIYIISTKCPHSLNPRVDTHNILALNSHRSALFKYAADGGTLK